MGFLHSPQSHSKPSQHSLPKCQGRGSPRAGSPGTHSRTPGPSRTCRRRWALRRGGTDGSAQAPLSSSSRAAAEGSERKHLWPTLCRTPPPGQLPLPQISALRPRGPQGTEARRASWLPPPRPGPPRSPPLSPPHPPPRRARRPPGSGGKSFLGRIHCKSLFTTPPPIPQRRGKRSY